jgi:hypothetical protein
MKLNNICSSVCFDAYWKKYGELISVQDLKIIKDPNLITNYDVTFDTDRKIIDVKSDMTFQALYSYAKELWRIDDGLCRFYFPFYSITTEQYEIGRSGRWKFSPNSHKHIKYAGWSEYNERGDRIRRYMGVVTLGNLHRRSNVVMLLGSKQLTICEVFEGPVCAAIRYYDDMEDFSIEIKSVMRVGNEEKVISKTTNEDIGISALFPICYRFPLSENATAHFEKANIKVIV